ncbi:calcium-translocating P-type ATPase [Biscogniauxia marginata]|nr:calcium-translocating P-type ATPase [Biscogniauxia marginata]
MAASEDTTENAGTPPPAKPGHGTNAFTLDLADALTPDPGTEDTFITHDNKFAFSPGQLSKMLNPKNHNAFYAMGGLAGLEKGLRTDRNTGLSVDETALDGLVTFEEVAMKNAPKFGHLGDTLPESKNPTEKSHPSPEGKSAGFIDRKRIFAENRLPDKKSKTLLDLAWQTYNDKVLILLTIAAVVSLALGLYQTFGGSHEDGEPRVEWIEGVAILVAIIIVVLVGTLNDWNMQRQFNQLNKKQSDRTVNVVRSGKAIEISIFDLLVGDVALLSVGDLVPVDGIFIDGHGIKCDESSATGESDLMKKVPADKVFAALSEMAEGKAGNINVDKLDPFIISGSKVQEGSGSFLVTAVGVNSSYGSITMSLRTEQEDTPLQRKLNVLADQIAIFGGGAALALFIALFIKFCVGLPASQSTPDEKGKEFLELFVVSVTVVVVAVPEGLPLAVTLALAFATTRMMKDNNLVRILKACETMGNATTICSDKTGTLTENKMKVVAATLSKDIRFGGNEDAMDDKVKSGNYADVDLEAKTPADAAPRESMPGDSLPGDSASEFVQALHDNTKQLIIQSNAVNSTAFEGDQDGKKTYIGSTTEVALLTFSRDHLAARPVQEERENANIVQQVPFDSSAKYMATVVKLPDGRFRAYVKGASEIVLDKCTRTIADPSSGDLSSVEMTEEDREIFNQTIASYAGQALRTIGTTYRDFESWPPAGAEAADDPKSADFSKVHDHMTLITIFGIQDPLRPSVIGALKDCRRAGIVVRMVTGDNILTGSAIAQQCGIYHPEQGGIAMEGPEFRRKGEQELKELVPNLQVLARSSPEDKRILVQTLKSLGETVAVTGDGTNDAPALKLADVGFAMGITGTEVAKEAADIILLDDNFASIIKGVCWGRAVNDSVKKFLQFQLTVNITAVVLTFVSAVYSDEEQSVLNAVQLLWVNLIMDTFAALALATDPPAPSVLDRKPDRKSAPLITARMGKMIIAQAICQLAISFVLYFGGSTLLGYRSDDPDSQIRLNTLVFNTFVWLQIFNEFNNRRLDNRLNIFEGITRNWFFVVINIIMIGGQVLIIFVGGQAFKIVPLDGKEWGISIGLGAISVPWGVVVRKFPDSWAAAIGRTVSWPFVKLYALLPSFKKKNKKGDAETAEGGKAVNHTDPDSDDFIRPSLRTMTSIRGPRVSEHIGLRQRVHKVKGKAKEKTKEKLHGTKEESETGFPK